MPDIDKLSKYFFKSSDIQKKHLTDKQLEKIRRYEDVFAFWMEHPSSTDAQVAQILRDKYKVSRASSFRETSEIKFLLGNVNHAAKEWARYQATDLIIRGAQLAESAEDTLTVKMAEAMIRAGKAMSDVHRLNKMDFDEIPFDDVAVPNWDPKYDPSLINDNRSEKEIEQQRQSLMKKYGIGDNISDAEIVND